MEGKKEAAGERRDRRGGGALGENWENEEEKRQKQRGRREKGRVRLDTGNVIH